MVLVIKISGFIGSLLPECVLCFCCEWFGSIIYLLPNKRKALLLSNLHHAYPDMMDVDRRRLARKSYQRLIEMGIFSLVAPFLSKSRLEGMIDLSSDIQVLFQKLVEGKEPVMFLSPHTTLTELGSFIPLKIKGELPELAAVFRPLKNEGLNTYVKASRERFGVKLLSRSDGFKESMAILRRKGWLTVLFDQNAGDKGTLISFMGRVASTTELPGLLAKRFKTKVCFMYFERTSFWRGELKVSLIDCNPLNPEDVLFKVNGVLEGLLKGSPAFYENWLWLHNRWKTQDVPIRRLGLSHKKILKSQIIRNSASAKMSRTRIWIRMSNWLGDVIMAIPLILALRKSRPDAEITLIANEGFIPLLKQLDLADSFISLSTKGLSRFLQFRKLKSKYPDVFVSLTNSIRGDIEAFLTACPQRFGILRHGKKRPLLTHRWSLPVDFNEKETHQLYLWKQFFQHFGLLEPLCYKPLNVFGGRDTKSVNRVGLICGSENSPEKRWSVDKWSELICQLHKEQPSIEFVLFGTATDGVITNQIINEAGSSNVSDRAGKTDLLSLSREFYECSLIVSNDTGGVHLANALGVPTLIVFGPTNPVRTRPVFDAPMAIVQPEGSPRTGGGDIDAIEVAVVVEKAKEILL